MDLMEAFEEMVDAAGAEKTKLLAEVALNQKVTSPHHF